MFFKLHMSGNSSFLLVSYISLIIFSHKSISRVEECNNSFSKNNKESGCGRWGHLFQRRKYLFQQNHIDFDKQGVHKTFTRDYMKVMSRQF